MNKELHNQICDYFTGPELAELLDITSENILDYLEEGVGLTADDIADLKEIMGVRDE
jgi:plasmid maintenance system antidote protein VapI